MSAPKSSLMTASQVIAMILPNLVTRIGAPSSSSLPYLYSPCSLTSSRAAISPRAARVVARKSGTVVCSPKRTPGLWSLGACVAKGSSDATAEQNREVAGGLHAGGTHGGSVTTEELLAPLPVEHAARVTADSFHTLTRQIEQAHAAEFAGAINQSDGWVATVEQRVLHSFALSSQYGLIQTTDDGWLAVTRFGLTTSLALGHFIDQCCTGICNRNAARDQIFCNVVARPTFFAIWRIVRLRLRSASSACRRISSSARAFLLQSSGFPRWCWPRRPVGREAVEPRELQKWC